MTEDTLQTLILVALLGCAVVGHAFIVIYFLRSQWRTTQPGRSLMYAKLAIAGMLDLSIARWFYGDDWPGRLYVLVVFFYAVFGSQAYLLFTLIATQTRRRGGDKRPGDAGARPDHEASGKH